MQPQDPNVRVLAQHYIENFTGLTTVTITLAYTPQQTVDGIGLEQVYKNGKLLAAGAVSSTTNALVMHRERRTGSTSATWTLSNTPDTGLELVFLNGTLLDAIAGAGHYTVSGAVVTLGTAPVVGDVLVAWYPTTTATTSSLGTSYTIAGNVITLDTAAIAGDVFLVNYPYRT